MMKFMLLFSRQGKVRLQKWFNAIGDKERKKITREVVGIVLSRRPKMSNFLDWKDYKVSQFSLLCIYFMLSVIVGVNIMTVVQYINTLKSLSV